MDTTLAAEAAPMGYAAKAAFAGWRERIREVDPQPYDNFRKRTGWPISHRFLVLACYTEWRDYQRKR
jgi:hypothetical protein